MKDLPSKILDAVDREYQTAREIGLRIGVSSRIVAQVIRHDLNNLVDSKKDFTTGVKRYRKRCV